MVPKLQAGSLVGFGDLDEAYNIARKALDLDAGQTTSSDVSVIALTEICIARGRITEAQHWLERWRESSFGFNWYVHWIPAVIEIADGKSPSREHLRQAYESARGNGDTPNASRCIALTLAVDAHRRNATRRRDELLAELDPRPLQNPWTEIPCRYLQTLVPEPIHDMPRGKLSVKDLIDHELGVAGSQLAERSDHHPARRRRGKGLRERKPEASLPDRRGPVGSPRF